MTALLLVRHGATAWTAERRLQGRTDIDLTEQGRADAVALRAAIDGWAPASVVVSPLLRARSTAAALSSLEPVVDERWAEATLGEWEGRVPADIGPAYAEWRAGRLVPPGGEPAAALRARIEGAVSDAARSDGPVLVVTHGGTIRAVLARYVGLTADLIQPVSAPSLTAIDVDPDGAARLMAFNVAR